MFEIVDQALDFVASKIARRVGTRSLGREAPVDYELPREAVAEAIVNAMAHRDYVSNASVQVPHGNLDRLPRPGLGISSALHRLDDGCLEVSFPAKLAHTSWNALSAVTCWRRARFPRTSSSPDSRAARAGGPAS